MAQVQKWLAGTLQSGTGALTLPFPTTIHKDEYAVIIIKTANVTPSFTTLAGFVDLGLALGTGTAGAAGAVKLTVYGRFIDVDSPATMTQPVLAAQAGGQLARIFTLKNVSKTGNPYDGTPASDVTNPADANVQIPGGTTTLDGCLIDAIVGHAIKSSADQVSGWSNTDLGISNTNEWGDNNSSAGVAGGGWAQAMVQQAVKGTFGPTAATLASASNQVHLMIAWRPEPPAGVADVPFRCGAGCGITGPSGVKHANDHWHDRGGALMTIETIPGIGTGYLSSPVGDVSYLQRNLNSTTRYSRVYVYFKNALPTTDAEIVQFLVAAGTRCELRFRVATGDVVGAIGSQFTSAQAVVPGVLYRFDVLGNVSANPRTMKMTAALGHGTGVDKGTASLAQAASVFTQAKVGASASTPTTAKVWWSWYRSGSDVTKYPVGQSLIIPLQTVADGTHVYNAVGDFASEAGNLPLAAVDAYTHLLGQLNNFTKYLGAPSAATTEYLEFLLGGMPGATSIPGYELVALMEGADQTAHQQTLQQVEGATVVDAWTNIDMSETVPMLYSKSFELSPAGSALTQAILNALKFRWKRGTGGVPRLAGVTYEVEYVPSAAAVPASKSFQQSPAHQYNAAGTYQVTLKATDNDGLVSSVTKSVVVT